MHPSQAEVHAYAAQERRAWCASVRLYGDSLPTLVRLREQGLKLALVSNCSIQAADAIRATGVGDVLDALLVSCDVGAMKPDPAIYLRACELLHVAPAACAFVGDGGSRELEAAHALGMATFRIERENHRGNHAEDQPYHHHLTALDDLPAIVQELP
jgi:putative hydrolase of the HAD superfamily